MSRRRRVSGSDDEEEDGEDEGRVTPAPTRTLPKRAACVFALTRFWGWG